MQNELRAENPGVPIQIIGVNEVGFESANAVMSEGRTAPLLQDVDENNNGISDVWYDLLGITYRDVKILNQQNEIIGTVNLTTPTGYDLGVQENYDALKQIIADVANQRPFWQNPDIANDVNNDGSVTANDALQCINELIFDRIGEAGPELPLPMPPSMPTPYLDVNGDGLITANDALRVINQLIGSSSGAQGEFISQREPVANHAEAASTRPDSIEQREDFHYDDGSPAMMAPSSDQNSQANRQATPSSVDNQRGEALVLSSDAVDCVLEVGDGFLQSDPISGPRV